MGFVEIRVVPYDHPDAIVMIGEVQQEYVIRYGGPDETAVAPAQFAPPLGLFLVGYLDGVPVTCGGWRVHDAGTAELKRMYVAPSVRGRGFARRMLAELERTAGAAGHRTLILETGGQQPEAISLYRSCGYAEVPRFGHYATAPSALHLGKKLVDP
jgi:GNAT superfamily N-acetyltransferase